MLFISYVASMFVTYCCVVYSVQFSVQDVLTTGSRTIYIDLLCFYISGLSVFVPYVLYIYIKRNHNYTEYKRLLVRPISLPCPPSLFILLSSLNCIVLRHKNDEQELKVNPYFLSIYMTSDNFRGVSFFSTTSFNIFCHKSPIRA